LESIVSSIGGDLQSSGALTPPRKSCLVCPFTDKFPTLKEAENLLLAEALNLAGNNQRLAAAYLGISRQALNKRLSRGV
ncbi:MAG: helix-turn-helix domain-containing protein, partial [Desulfuromonadaceae bacterium]|nr:helix-turn-helix domain-containing protein [Desulfuromonadaceae bacterium]